MANDEHVSLILQGVAAWNEWRFQNPDACPDLSRAYLKDENLSGANLNQANLSEAILSGANLKDADLSGANLSKANLVDAHLRGAYLREANLHEAFLESADLIGADIGKANLSRANLTAAKLTTAYLSEANLSGANLRGTHLMDANLSRANLKEAYLSGALMMETNLMHADLTGCLVYGVSAWGLKLEGATQRDLIVTPEFPGITVDNIEIAQFVYLMLHNEKIRNVIDTIGKKGVLLLGRFAEGRIEILERLREKLRSLGFVPMVFNFDRPETKDFTETVRLLANLSHFVIVDITNPRSAPLELQATVPDTMVPFAPILQKGEKPFSMFVDLTNKYDWVLKDVIEYPSVDRLIEVLEREIIEPAETKFNELLSRRAEQLRLKGV